MTLARPMFLFDGDCAFCSSCARFIERRVRTTAEVLPWQFAELTELGVSQRQAEEAVQWVSVDKTVHSGTKAISVLLRQAQWYWRPWGWLLVAPPISWFAPIIYRWVSRNRHRMPGGTAMCALPQAQRDQLPRM